MPPRSKCFACEITGDMDGCFCPGCAQLSCSQKDCRDCKLHPSDKTGEWKFEDSFEKMNNRHEQEIKSLQWTCEIRGHEWEEWSELTYQFATGTGAPRKRRVCKRCNREEYA